MENDYITELDLVEVEVPNEPTMSIVSNPFRSEEHLFITDYEPSAT